MPDSSATPAEIDYPGRRRLPLLLRRSWFSLNQAFRRRILHTGITPDQFTVLRTLTEGDPKGLTQRQIAEIISSDPNTIASLLERMETGGMIERQTHETDRRAHRIIVLPQGRKTYKTARAIAIDLQTEILETLPEESREAFLEHLATVADACRVAAEKSPKAKRN